MTEKQKIKIQLDYAIDALMHYKCSSDIPEKAELALKKIQKEELREYISNERLLSIFLFIAFILMFSISLVNSRLASERSANNTIEHFDMTHDVIIFYNKDTQYLRDNTKLFGDLNVR